jgi:RNA polymerase sigma factor (sigma-70 family)
MPQREICRDDLRAAADERLVMLARAGSEAAFEAIVARYHGPLLGHAARIVRRPEAEDAVQHAFTGLYRRLRRDNRPLHLKPWLYTVTRNAALNIAMHSSAGWREIPENHDGVKPPDEIVADRMRLQDVLLAAADLPDRQRVALVRHALEGRPGEEIAAELKTTPQSVRQLVRRARASLRDAAWALWPWPLLRWLPDWHRAGGAAATASGATGGMTAAVAAVGVLAVTGAVPAPQSDGAARDSSEEPRVAHVERVGAPARGGPGLARVRRGGDTAAPERVAQAPGPPPSAAEAGPQPSSPAPPPALEQPVAEEPPTGAAPDPPQAEPAAEPEPVSELEEQPAPEEPPVEEEPPLEEPPPEGPPDEPGLAYDSVEVEAVSVGGGLVREADD